MICVHGRVPTHNELVAFLLQRYKEDYGKIKIPNYLEVFRNSTREELTKENQENMVIFLLLIMWKMKISIIFLILI